jgi:simple sugar transport system ATP-binding protein
MALAGITKRYGTTTAVDDVSFQLRRGTVHALLGENGAGKTTLMRIAFGLVHGDSGKIVAQGRAIAASSDSIAAGVGMVHQHFTNVPAMTVAENVSLGGRGRLDIARAAARVTEIGDRTGLRLNAFTRAEDLAVGAQQRLEIVKALARDATILILDEPTAVLAPNETDELLQWLRGYAMEGNAVVLITHKLRDALNIADDITVLRRGRVTLSAKAKDVSVESVSAALLGEELDVAIAPAVSRVAGDVIAAANQVTIVDERGATMIRDANLEIRGGEIVGIAAVEGAGHRELLRALAGRLPVSSGDVRLPPSVGFVPEDRQRDALVLDFSAVENIALRGAGRRRERLRWDALREHAGALLAQFDVRGGSDDSPVRSLSGGNQQKLVLARELDGGAALLVVENPTRGLDIRATSDVHGRLRAVAGSGAAVVVYSSDLDEVLSLATRVVVVHAGNVRECVRDRDIVGRAMLGVA